jgi:hypothetical protein
MQFPNLAGNVQHFLHYQLPEKWFQHLPYILITATITVLHICAPVSAVLCVHMSLFQELLFFHLSIHKPKFKHFLIDNLSHSSCFWKNILLHVMKNVLKIKIIWFHKIVHCIHCKPCIIISKLKYFILMHILYTVCWICNHYVNPIHQKGKEHDYHSHCKSFTVLFM